MLVEKALLQTIIKNFAEKQRYESVIAKHVTDNQKKSNQSVKVLKTLLKNQEQSLHSYVKDNLVA